MILIFPDSRILISLHGARKDTVQLQLGNLRRADNHVPFYHSIFLHIFLFDKGFIIIFVSDVRNMIFPFR